MGTDAVGGTYGRLWLIMWPLGIIILAGLILLVLRQINHTIIAATQQHWVQMIITGRHFLIEHPELGEEDLDTDFGKFVAEMGGWGRYFSRRNIISSLELLYFQRKGGAVDRAFFVSHCNHIRPWFGNANFMKTWEQSRSMHDPEFCIFVDRMLKEPTVQVDPYNRLRVLLGLTKKARRIQ